MNYRHAYHAGNFADVTKHIILSRILTYLKRKDAPFFAMDTHAGTGLYALGSEEARKTEEFKRGVELYASHIGDAPQAVQALCQPFNNVLSSLNPCELKIYPGSPNVAQSIIRVQDRLSLVELHPKDFNALTKNFNWAKNTKTHNLDAWVAMRAQLPPKEKRGLVLIDPPFEDRDEFNAILRALHDAQKRFANGTYMIWYPIKDKPLVESFRDVLSRMKLGHTIDISLLIDQPTAEPTFLGSGTVVVNPPYLLKDELNQLLPWLKEVFETSNGCGAWSINEIVAEN